MAKSPNKFVDGILNRRCKFCDCVITVENCTYTNKAHVLRICKPCYLEQARIRNKKRYENGPDKMRESRIKGLYNLSMEKYTEMLTKQNGVCAICKKINKDGKPLFVDHDHITNQNRGLVCFRCNVILGHSEDSKELLMEFINYLIRYSTIDSKLDSNVERS